MPDQTPPSPSAALDEELSKAQLILQHWNMFAPQIQQVRDLEQGTMATPKAVRDIGYYRLPALQGYQQIVNAYALIGGVTPAQSDKLMRVSAVTEALQNDEKMLGDHPTPSAISDYSAVKMQELQQTGETYMLSGHRTHFNITKIKRQPDGSLTYTLYDAGHESKVVDVQQGRAVINAVQENTIKPGTDIRNLIETDVAKKVADSESPEYKAAKGVIEGALKDPPVRVERDWGQRKGNCTTRGQRILAADILQDTKLSEGLYDFASNVGGTSMDDIKKSLQERVDYLEGIKMGADKIPANAWRGMDIANFTKASDPGNFQIVTINSDAGERMAVYRTKPDAFSKDELNALQGTLKRNGVNSSVRESQTKPGQFYLYVPVENADRIAPALAGDTSPVAEAYHKYGPRAADYIDTQSFVKASDPANFEHAAVGKPGGGLMEAYRTKPGVFNKAELETLQDKLKRGGLEAAVKQSVSQPGQYYLYVPPEDAARVGSTLARDVSPAADLYRKFGAQAGDHIEPVHVALPPNDIITDKSRWKSAQTENGALVTRIPLTGMAEGEINALEAELVKNGLSPKRRVSSELGPTLRLEGTDAVKFAGLQKDLGDQAKAVAVIRDKSRWKSAATDDGTPLTRIAIGGMPEDEVKALEAQLAKNGLTPVRRQSSTLGPTLRLEGPDNVKFALLQKYLPSAAMSPAPVTPGPALRDAAAVPAAPEEQPAPVAQAAPVPAVPAPKLVTLEHGASEGSLSSILDNGVRPFSTDVKEQTRQILEDMLPKGTVISQPLVDEVFKESRGAYRQQQVGYSVFSATPGPQSDSSMRYAVLGAPHGGEYAREVYDTLRLNPDKLSALTQDEHGVPAVPPSFFKDIQPRYQDARPVLVSFGIPDTIVPAGVAGADKNAEVYIRDVTGSKVSAVTFARQVTDPAEIATWSFGTESKDLLFKQSTVFNQGDAFWSFKDQPALSPEQARVEINPKFTGAPSATQGLATNAAPVSINVNTATPIPLSPPPSVPFNPPAVTPAVTGQPPTEVKVTAPAPPVAPVIVPVEEVKPRIIAPAAAAIVEAEGSRFTPSTPLGGRLQTGVAGLGIAQSLVGLEQAYQTGDKVEGTISGVNLATSSLSATESILAASSRVAPVVTHAAPVVEAVAPAAEKALPLLSRAGKFVPGLNVATVVADGVYQVSKEDTRQHKTERAVAVGTTAAVSLGLGTATASAAEGVVLTGALGAGGAAVATVALPVVAVAAAGYAVAKTGDAVIQNKRAWDGLDQQIAESGVPKRRDVKLLHDDGKPSIIRYGHIVSALLDVSPTMQDGALTAPLDRGPRGRMKIDQIQTYDMHDPKNIKEFERALDARIAADEKTAADNSSALPRWLRFSDSLGREEDARMDLAPLQAAKTELQMYKKELADSAAQQNAQSRFVAPPAAEPAPASKPVSLQRPPKPQRVAPAAAPSA